MNATDFFLPDITSKSTIETGPQELNIPYTVCEVLVAVMAVIGNALVIIVFRKERKLRRRTNYYIVSLAAADFLVGLLGIPFAILASVGLPTNLHACLFTVSLLVVLCTISIFCLVAVSVDRYWAILHPMGYSRNVRTKTALVIISACWMVGTLIGFLPLLGWNAGETADQKCFFVGVMDYNYLVFLYFATIITPSLLLAAFYAHIYRVVLKQLRQIVTMNPDRSLAPNTNGHIRASGGTMLRMLGAAQKREVKATQNLSIIVLFFVICWIPLYTINCVQAFCRTCSIHPTLTNFCIILSHLNSAGNPLLYAYHLRDFRAALKCYILGLFGVRERQENTCVERNCRPSLASNNYSYKKRYVRNSNLNYTNSRLCKSAIDVSKRLPIGIPIVAGTTAVVAASAGERTNREMWMITELPSTSLSENNLERECAIFPDEASIVRDITSESSSSGKINSGYVEGPIDDLEIGDDDVFYADASTLSINGSNLGSESSGIFKNPNIIKNNQKSWYLSSSSPQLSRSLFLIETDSNSNNNNSQTETNAKGKTTVSLSTSGDFSPSKSLKLSPFKAVGEYLLQHNSSKQSKSGNKTEITSYADLPEVTREANRNGAIVSRKQMNEMTNS